MSETFTFRARDPETDVWQEVELTPAQALDLGAGQPVAYFPRDERVYVDEDGTITQRESAIPPAAG